MYFLNIINNFYSIQHPDPVVPNRVALKISSWRPSDDEPDPPGAGGAIGRPISRQ
jgi:hypothetical protein